MSEEIQSADSLLTQLAEARADLELARAYLSQARAERRAAIEDNAGLREALEDRHACATCSGKGSYWTDVGGEAEHEVCDCWIRADHVLYHEEHPGAALLAELEAARAVVAAARTGFGTEADILRAYAFDPNLLTARIRAYDAATKARDV